jgi:replicative DNA helicase
MADGATPNTYREMPHNIEAEQALLGAIFVWNEAYHRVADVIGPEHFFDPLHAEIFAHMGVVIGELRRHCTPVTMAPFFETAPPIDKSLTVPQYLGRIAAGAITIITAVDYAKTIRDLAVRRQLVRLGTDLVNSAYDAPIDFPPAEQIVAAEQALYELAERGPRDDLEVDFGVAADRAVEQVNAAYERGTGLIIIDYLQLMDDQSRENRTQGLTYLTKGLKALAKELAVPIIVLSQLNRKVEERNDKRPQLADLRESGSIEQDADIVMFCYREEYYLEREVPPASEPDKVTEHAARLAQAQGRAEIILAKHRHAPTGIVHCGFDNARTRFFDLAQEHPAMGGR